MLVLICNSVSPTRACQMYYKIWPNVNIVKTNLQVAVLNKSRRNFSDLIFNFTVGRVTIRTLELFLCHELHSICGIIFIIYFLLI
jgi:hypothetical protein